MEINLGGRFIKLAGRTPFDKEIPLGQDVTITVDGLSFIANCVKQETFDNQDGTVDVVHVLKSTLD